MKKIMLFLLVFLWGMNVHAATISVLNMDGENEGFNDPTPFISVGGNHASTLGEARLIAFKYAANLLAEVIPSQMEIRIEANMDPLGGSFSNATLGAAGPTTVAISFDRAPHNDTWYPIALANHLSASDLNADEAEIIAIFNSDIDGTTTFGSSRWYYGLDTNPPSSHPDFVSVVLHELVHGLGFISLIDPQTGQKAAGRDDIFSRHLEHTGATPEDFPSMTDTKRAAASIAAPDLHWNGVHVTAKAVSSLSLGVSASKVEMYAPAVLEEGSSVSHFSDRVFPNELMMPYYLAPNHHLGLAAQLLSDIGWGNEADLQLTITSAQASGTEGDALDFGLTLSNNGPDLAEDIVLNVDVPEGLSTPVFNSDEADCVALSNVLWQCRLAQLAATHHAQLDLSLTPQSAMTLNLVADLNANVVDPQSANNRASETFAVSANTDSATSDNNATDNTTDPAAEGGNDSALSGGSGSFDVILGIFLVLLLLGVISKSKIITLNNLKQKTRVLLRHARRT